VAGIVALAIVLIAGQLIGLLVWMAVTVAALLIGFWIYRSIGGLTGDSYGAIEEVNGGGGAAGIGHGTNMSEYEHRTC